MTLFVPAEISSKAREMAAVRVAGALRAFDHDAGSIDIECEPIR